MDEPRVVSLIRTELFRADRPSFRAGRALLYFDARKDVIDIVVGDQGDLVQGACLNALDDFLAGEVENRLQNLRALLLVRDRKSTRLNSSHVRISYAVFCFKKKIA